MKRNIIICFCALFFCHGCHSSQYISGDIEGEYFFYWGNGEVLPSLPSITFSPDLTFDYIVPGVGGPYHSKGTWKPISQGLLLSTQFICIGANIKKIGLSEIKDSIDVYVSCLESQKQIDYIGIDKSVIYLDNANHFRTTANMLIDSELIIDGFDVYTICIQDSIVNGYKYKIILVDNPYYPIINNEVWLLSEDGTLRRSVNNNTCIFRKAIHN